ncbi:MAG TPA: N-acetyl-gamma-glutamyl-phosphate reductase [Planctomycetaceae bacterium]|nr:N-acetyl-gamma-glutamyl-phosphate reductase [Planctomycetaceae bacterium]
MIDVAILGATGYTALEAMKILLRHPDVRIVAVTSRQEGRTPVSSVHPSLVGRLDLPLEDLGPEEVGSRAACVFSCLPHCASAEIVPRVLAAGARVVDFSADYRLDDAETYREWYGHEHPDADRLGRTVYGLPELFRDGIREARLVANPGCYSTSAILPLAPLLARGMIEGDDIIVDSKSGVSGAGRTPKLMTHFPECNESMSAYNVGRHRHTPEIEQVVARHAGARPRVIFTPQLAPMDRGILSTIYAKPTRTLTERDVMDALRDAYAGERFVRVVDHLPGTKDTVDTNFCDVTARVVGGRILLISCLDNLVKGAAGAAVQNFNVLFGLPETAGLP